MRLRRNELIGISVRYKEGDSVGLWMPKKKRWQWAYRVLFDSGRAVLVENLGSIFNRPRRWARLRGRGGIIVLPQVDDSNEEPLEIGENSELRPWKQSIPSKSDFGPESAAASISSHEIINARGEVRRGRSEMAKVAQQRIQYGPSKQPALTSKETGDTPLLPLQSRGYQDFPLFADSILYGDMSRQYDWNLDQSRRSTILQNPRCCASNRTIFNLYAGGDQILGTVSASSYPEISQEDCVASMGSSGA